MNKLLLIALACVFVSCEIPKHFHSVINLNYFNKNQVNDTVLSSTKHSEKTILTRLPDSTFVLTTYVPKHTKIVYQYYYPSGQLKGWIFTISGFKYYKSPLYNEYGNLISVTDYDAPFKYTINKLAAKLVSGYGLDLYLENTTIIRSNENKKPTYRVTFPVNSSDVNSRRQFVIDGLDGKVLSDKIINLPEKETSTTH